MIKIAHFGLHFGEEPFISGKSGSGTIFFYNCNMKCVFCQNFQISQVDINKDIYKQSGYSEVKLAGIMLSLQEQKAHNINLVSPTHFAPQIAQAIYIARKKGLKIPIIYNTNGYDSCDTLKLLEGLIDIYLPDIKYSGNKNAEKYSNTSNYVEVNRRAIKEMYRQVGNLIFDKNGIAQRGLIVRHLVLPNDIAGSKESLKFLVGISKSIYIGIMSQYNPCFQSREYPELNRKITNEEYENVVQYARSLGFSNVLIQDNESSDNLNPDFDMLSNTSIVLNPANI
jgi:putative pyruvate formate lyase activating enzyme